MKRNFLFAIRFAITFIIILLSISASAQITGPGTVCVGATITLTGAPSGGTWTSSNSSIATVGSSSGIVGGVIPGVVTISYTTSGTVTTTITVNPLPALFPVTGGGTYCAGTGGLHINLSGSTSGVNYELFNGGISTGVIVAGTTGVLDFGLQTAAGTYTVVATNTITGCSRTMSGSTTISINPAPAAIAGPSATCLGSTMTLSSTTAGGTWTSSAPGIASIGSSTGFVTGVTLGTATITYTIATGCFTTTPVTIGLATCPVSGSTSICMGASSTLSYCYTGGTWTSSATSIATIGSLSGLLSGITPGTSTISYSLGTGCNLNTVITVNSTPASISGPSSACAGSTITLSNAIPGGTWSSSATGTATVSSGGVVTGVASGVVTISYTISGCPAVKTITVNAAPASISGASSVCVGSVITLTDAVSGGVWSTSSSAISLGTATGALIGISAGSPTVTYSIGSCIATTTITVNPSAPIMGAANVCTGLTITLTNAVPGGTWSSSVPGIAAIGSSSGIVSGLTPGLSVVTYSLSTGCTAVRTVTVYPTPAPIVGPSILCSSTSTTLTDPTPGGVWSTFGVTVAVGSLTGIVTPLTFGPATVTYDVGGCFASITFTITPGPASITGTMNVCVGSTTTLTDAVPGGTWGSTIPSIATIGSSSGIVTGITSGTTLISYELGTCPPVFAAMVVNPILPIAGTPIVCVGQTTPLTDVSLGGAWSSSAISIATINSTTGLVTGVAAGVATITYTLSTGCTATMTITVNPAPLSLTGTTTLCLGQTVTLGPSTLTGGVWNSGNPSVATVSSSGDVTGIGVGISGISYTFIATGCVSSLTVTVSSAPPAISGPNDICLGSLATFTDISSGGTWSSSDATIIPIGSASGIATGLAVGTVTLSYSVLGLSCPATKVVNVVSSTAAIVGPDNICVGSPFTYTDPSPGGTWSSSNPSIANISLTTGTANGIAAGVVTISYNRGCIVTKSVTVNAIPVPISGLTNICTGNSSILTNGTPGGIWSSTVPSVATIGSLSGVVNGISAGTTIISYTLSTGCATSVVVFVDPSIAPITGINTVCIGTTSLLNDITPGGVWSSSSPGIATVSGPGLVTGMALGTTTITYIVGATCPAIKVVTVNNFPGAIGGSSTVCVGSTTILTNTVGGGAWSSSDITIATVNPASGAVTGVSAGFVTITYMMGASCLTTATMMVIALPSPISGSSTVCATQSVVLSDATPGGVWSSSSTSIATVNPTSGMVSGVAAGTTSISYTAPTGCSATYPFTVNPMPAPISGPSSVCLLGTIALTDAVGSGTWTSAVPGIASVGSSTGFVTGFTLASTTITYQLPAGCYVTKLITVSPLPTAYTVTGGGSYCSGGTGVHIGLSNSVTGVNYLLYHGATAVGTFSGTGGALDFGLHTITGTYTAIGTNTSTTCSINMIGSVTVNIMPAVVPSVTFSASPNDTICDGATLTCTPTAVNGGLTPTYQWSVNGSPVSSAGTYSYIPANGDIVKVVMTSSALCPLAATASHSDTITTLPFGAPVVTIDVTPNDSVCLGTPVTLHALPLFGGTAPAYTWIKDGLVAGGTAYYSFVPNDGDQVFCIMTSNHPCRSANIDTSTTVTFMVDTPVIPSLYIAAHPSTTIGIGESDTLTANVTNAVNPTYQWFVNNLPIAGATTNTYISTFNYPQPDSVTCLVTSNGICTLSTYRWLFINVINLGVTDLSSFSNISIVPNPSQGIFVIKGNTGSVIGDELLLDVTNMLGQTVYKGMATAQNGKLNYEVQLDNDLPNGMYLFMLRSGTETKAFHIVLEK